MSNLPNQLPRVTIYTDGACDPNPGPGGWAAILRSAGRARELSGGEPDTTNNRMELSATIEALNALKQPCQIELFTDSEYLKLGITARLARWISNGWRTSAKKPVANQDLWLQLVEAMQPHTVDWHWVRGHAGNPNNQRADQLARAAIPRADFALDDPAAAHLYAAASCLGAAGPGAWAVVLRQDGQLEEHHGFEQTTTANRLQVRAVAEGLKQLTTGTRVHVHMNSDYVHQGGSKWIGRWQRKGWRTKSGQPVKNIEEWQALAAATVSLDIRWHRSTSANSESEAIRAREIAAAAARTATENID